MRNTAANDTVLVLLHLMVMVMAVRAVLASMLLLLLLILWCIYELDAASFAAANGRRRRSGINNKGKGGCGRGGTNGKQHRRGPR